jgi:rfaE bifunctional protein kinase chain/domain
VNRSRVREILDRAASRRVLVIGDVMLDEFLWGSVARISPEAPVPVVEVTGESFYPGGAANVARNVAVFASRVAMLGVTGCDEHGRKLASILADSGIDVEPLIEDPGCQTTLKTRVIARHQQIVRVDREKRLQPSEALLTRCRERLRAAAANADALIVSDYGKGLLQQALVDDVCDLARERGMLLTVDPNPYNPRAWRGATAIKPNRAEAFRAARASGDFDLPSIGRELLNTWDAGMVLITLGEEGMALFERAHEPYYTPARAKEVFDVSGAGDTAIALFTLALAAAATPPEAAEIANRASGVVVGKLGTATLTRDELLGVFED